jgi:hypothetical protein
VTAAVDLLGISRQLAHHRGHPWTKQLEEGGGADSFGMYQRTGMKEACKKTIHPAEKREIVQ